MERWLTHGRTGERVDEQRYRSNALDYGIYLFHLATYDFARPLVGGGRVLDFGCGTGYGTKHISATCREIVGVDISAEAIAVAAERYVADNLAFRQIERVEVAAAPFDSSSFDAVLSFQVIEHISEPDAYLREIVRLLRPGGVAVFATPDRRTRLGPGQRPWNRFHVTEYDPPSLQSLLARHFDEVDLFTMSAEPRLLGPELRRARRLRFLTYPFTWPGAPEPWRQLGLRTLKAAEAASRRARSKLGTHDGDSPDFQIDASAVMVRPGATDGINVLAVARSHGERHVGEERTPDQ